MARERLTTRHWLLTKLKVKLGVLFIIYLIENRRDNRKFFITQ